MIGVDTNVWIRFLVEDDPEQCRRATELIEGALARGEDLFLSHLALAEIVWVLTSRYRFARNEVVAALDSLFHAGGIMIENRPAAHNALDAFKSSGGDLADYLMLEVARAEGCRSFATFDQALLREPDAFEPGSGA